MIRKINGNALIALIITCYGLFLRLRTLDGRNLWTDEVYQFNCMQGAFKPFWLRQTYGDFTSYPGEYILCYPWIRIFGMNKWGLVVPHLLFTILGFYLLYLLCCRYMRSWAGFAAAFLIYALNNNLVYHSLEFRPYAVLPVLALASLWIFHQLNEHFQDLSLLDKGLIAAAIIFIVNYHTYGILICLLPLVFILMTGPADLVGRGLRFLFISLSAAVLIWLWYASFNHFGGAIIMQPKVFAYIPSPWIEPTGFLKAIIGNLAGNHILYFLLIGCLPFWPQGQRVKLLAFLAVLIILPVGLVLFADLKSHYWFLQRQFIWVMPFFALWVGWSVDSNKESLCAFTRK